MTADRVDDALRDLWQRADRGIALTPADLEAGCRPAVAAQTRALRLNILAHLPLLAAVILADVANLALCLQRPGPLAAHTALTIVAVGFLTYGLYLLSELRALVRADQPLATSIRRHLEFCRVKFEIWLIAVAATAMLAGLAGAALTDNLDGGWRVNDPSLLAKILLGVFLAMYLSLKVSLQPFLTSLKALLQDLEAQSTDGAGRLLRLRPLWRRIGTAAVLASTALLVWLVWWTARGLH